MIENRLAEYARAIDMSVKMTSNHAARSLFALNNAVAELSEGGKALNFGADRTAYEGMFANAGAVPTAKKLNRILSKLREVNEELVEVERITRGMVERATGTERGIDESASSDPIGCTVSEVQTGEDGEKQYA